MRHAAHKSNEYKSENEHELTTLRRCERTWLADISSTTPHTARLMRVAHGARTHLLAHLAHRVMLCHDMLYYTLSYMYTHWSLCLGSMHSTCAQNMLNGCSMRVHKTRETGSQRGMTRVTCCEKILLQMKMREPIRRAWRVFFFACCVYMCSATSFVR